MTQQELYDILEGGVLRHNRWEFIADDPIQIPHQFRLQQDIEIAGLFAALLAWGSRVSIIRSADRLMQLFDREPYSFVMNANDRELNFVHRTFNSTDLNHLIGFLRFHYQRHKSLETAFLVEGQFEAKSSLTAFHQRVYQSQIQPSFRTQKHIANPQSGSACKRLNMFLRWMVRRDDAGVDFGLWRNISMAHLHIPLDVHVQRSAQQLGLLNRKQSDWKACEELTLQLKKLNPQDPVRYDYALFGLGIEAKMRPKSQ
ncbi:MAG: TIGR02757 family protein [Bacteroidia bacterium]